MLDDKTTPIIDSQGLLALERMLAQIKADHPSTAPIGLWHGQGESSARYIEAAKNAGFTMHLSTTENELVENIGTIEGITLALVVRDFSAQFSPSYFHGSMQEIRSTLFYTYLILLRNRSGVALPIDHHELLLGCIRR